MDTIKNVVKQVRKIAERHRNDETISAYSIKLTWVEKDYSMCPCIEIEVKGK